jgi:ferric-dicitrate binding protein FerR (iron transport regulator)
MSTKSNGDNDLLEKVLLLAEPRKPVDSARARVIEEMTHERWQATLVRRRAVQRRRKFTVFGGGLAVAASIVLAVILMPPSLFEAPMVATVMNVLGSPATAERGHAMTALSNGAELHAGSVLETATDDGVALQLVSGHSLRLAAASRVRIEADAVVLDVGSVYLDSGGDGRATPIEIRSRIGTVRELGTQYMVQLSGNSLDVSVREGTVRVAKGNTVAMANAGEMLQLDESGRTLKLDLIEYGQHWEWAARLAPVPDINGLSLAEFLRWLAREQGWHLEYATPELARLAESVELRGSIEGLSGEEALKLVMMSTGWRYKLENGSLTIESLGEDPR